MSDSAPGPEDADVRSLTLVLASNRSGSTLLCYDIENLGGLGAARAYLHDLGKSRGSAKPTEAEVMAQLARGVRESGPGVGALKLMVHHAANTWEAISGERVGRDEALGNVVGWAQRRFDRLFLVFLVRNALDQAISQVVADATGVYHSEGDAYKAGLAEQPLQISDVNERIMRQLQRVVRDRDVLMEVYERHSDVGLLVTYDELSRRPDETFRRLVSHARRSGFEVQNEKADRVLEKVVSEELSSGLRQGFLEYLATETGTGPPTTTAIAERRALRRATRHRSEDSAGL